MFKTLSQQTKEIIFIVIAAASVVVVFLVNVLSLVPALISVYRSTSTPKSSQTIDADTVNKAIQYLE